MKRIATLFLAIALLLSLSGCASRAAQPSNPVTFYYPRREIAYNVSDGLIASETRESEAQTLEALLRAYLKGPQTASLRLPFPAGTRLISAERIGAALHILLDAPVASFGSLDKTIAYACLSLTALGLTDAESVSIQTLAGQDAGEAPIVLSKASLVLTDDAPTPSESPE